MCAHLRTPHHGDERHYCCSGGSSMQAAATTEADSLRRKELFTRWMVCVLSHERDEHARVCIAQCIEYTRGLVFLPQSQGTKLPFAGFASVGLRQSPHPGSLCMWFRCSNKH